MKRRMPPDGAVLPPAKQPRTRGKIFCDQERGAWIVARAWVRRVRLEKRTPEDLPRLAAAYAQSDTLIG